MNFEIIVKSVGVDGIHNPDRVFFTSDDLLKYISPDGVPLGSATIQLVNYDTLDTSSITIYKDNKKVKVETEKGKLYDSK